MFTSKYSETQSKSFVVKTKDQPADTRHVFMLHTFLLISSAKNTCFGFIHVIRSSETR